MPHAHQPVLKPLGPDDPREVSGYQLLAKVGEGGMGAVYLTHTRGNQPVALKVIRREFARNPDFRARFEQEVQAARRVSGYHIVPVVDHDVSGDEPWIATSYVPGMALDDALAAYGPLPLPAALQLIGCTAQALHSVHSASVIHRDLKPSNILLSSNGPWVIDFGIARATDANQLTQTGGFIGTPQYMSPEHALGRKVTPATDIFALGLIAAVVATGRHPYGDGSGLSIAATIANTAQQPPDLSGYPEPLRQLLEACLAADPERRPAPAALADWCAQAAGRELRDFADWLPAPLAKEIARREEAAKEPPLPEPRTAAASPGFGPAYVAPQAAAPGQQPPAAYAATQAAAPSPAPSAQHQGYAPTPPPAYAVPTQAAAPPAGPPASVPAPRPSRRNGGAIVIGTVLAVALVGGGVWALTRGDDDGGDRRTHNAGNVSSPTPRGTARPAPHGYELAYANKPLTLVWPKSTVGQLNTDLDTAEQQTDENIRKPGGPSFGITQLEWRMEYEKLTTPHRFTSSLSPDEKGCELAARNTKRQLPREMGASQLTGSNALIKNGDWLCTITSEGNLAMVKITSVRPTFRDDNKPDLHQGRPGIPTYTAQLTLWKPKP
ncbi:serine/threonine-protein kinase [Streptomyces sp. P1-3]|uniref:serine/threonine-protein kinase n=1 Tax=Streptomyces sp. P1-3 TaxID=3421658 RepID=UPI003D362472